MYFYLIHQIKRNINRLQIHLNRSITFKGGRFFAIGIFLGTKKGVAQKSPPPNELSLRFSLGDTRALTLQTGVEIRLSSCSSRFGHILTKTRVLHLSSTLCILGYKAQSCTKARGILCCL